MDSLGKRQLILALNKLYPNASSELNFKNEFEVVIAVALSAQCTDKKVNEVTKVLFAEYKNFSTLARAKLQDIEAIIRQVNYYKTKSKNIIALAQKVTEEFSGKLPRTHTELISLAGVGRKTANVVLSELGIAATFPVDTHVFRVSKRLGLALAETVDKVEAELCQEFESKYWRQLHHQLIYHGRRVCKAQSPECGGCGIAKLCQYKAKNINKNE